MAKRFNPYNVPIEPYRPTKPPENISVVKNILTENYDSYESIDRSVVENWLSKDFTFISIIANHSEVYGDSIDISLNVKVDSPNPHFNTQMREYEKSLKKYHKDLEAYKIKKAEWDKQKAVWDVEQAKKEENRERKMLAKLKAKYEK